MVLPFDRAVVIIPTYNEADNIEKMLATLKEKYPELSVLIIDDNSPDGTAQMVETWQKDNPNVHLLKRAGKLGLGTAYVTGFKWALENNYDFIFEMDCDFSHDPSDLKNLLQAAQINDLVIGSRYVEGIRIINWPFKRLLLSYLASIYTRFITRIPLLDTTGGFKCFRREALALLDLNKIMSNGYSFQLEVNYKLWAKGARIKEVPIIFYERRDGQSKMNKKIVIEAVFAVFFLRFKRIFNLL